MTTSFRLLVVLLISTYGFSACAQQVKSDSAVSSPRIVYTVVDRPPAFTGGSSELNWYLRKNLRYPEAARKARLEGRVFVSFIVNDQGGIEDVHVLNSLNREMDAEAVRLVQEMPTWIPGKQNGKPVNCRFNLPVIFIL